MLKKAKQKVNVRQNRLKKKCLTNSKSKLKLFGIFDEENVSLQAILIYRPR